MRKQKLIWSLLVGGALLMSAPSAFAYVGPALGLAPLGAILSVIVTSFSVTGYIVVSNVRRLWRRVFGGGTAEAERSEAEAQDETVGPS